MKLIVPLPPWLTVPVCVILCRHVCGQSYHDAATHAAAAASQLLSVYGTTTAGQLRATAAPGDCSLIARGHVCLSDAQPAVYEPRWWDDHGPAVCEPAPTGPIPVPGHQPGSSPGGGRQHGGGRAHPDHPGLRPAPATTATGCTAQTTHT